MLASERSNGALVFALIAAAIVGASFALPWLTYDYSSGRQTAEGGFHDPENTGIERQHIDFAPGSVEGDTPPADAAQADKLVGYMLIALAVGVGGFVLMALAELPGLSRILPRWLSLTACIVAVLATGVALAITWFWLPDTLQAYGVDGPMDYTKLEPRGYTRTTIGLGWILAFTHVPFALGAFAFKYQAGSTDPTVVESLVRKRSRKEATP